MTRRAELTTAEVIGHAVINGPIVKSYSDWYWDQTPEVRKGSDEIMRVCRQLGVSCAMPEGSRDRQVEPYLRDMLSAYYAPIGATS